LIIEYGRCSAVLPSLRRPLTSVPDCSNCCNCSTRPCSARLASSTSALAISGTVQAAATNMAYTTD
jgi:hypothetical protein